MNKKEFVQVLSENTKLSKNVCERVFNETIKIIKDSFYGGSDICINNFGKFCYKEIKPRKRYLPSLKCVRQEKYKIIPKFIPSKSFFGKII